MAQLVWRGFLELFPQVPPRDGEPGAYSARHRALRVRSDIRERDGHGLRSAGAGVRDAARTLSRMTSPGAANSQARL